MISPTIIISPIQWDIITEIDQANTEHAIPPECPQDKLFVPEILRKRTIDQVHTALSSGHPGINTTIQLLQNRFWWPTLRKDTITQVRQFQVCQTQKPSRQLPAGLLQPLPIPHRPWSHIAIDFITDLPKSNGHTIILTVIDRFSKACLLIPLPKLPTALETAEHLCNPGLPFLRIARGYCLRPRAPIHLTALGRIFQSFGSKCQPHFWVPSSIKRSRREAQSGARSIPSVVT